MTFSETADLVIVGAGELWSRDPFSRSLHFRDVVSTSLDLMLTNISNRLVWACRSKNVPRSTPRCENRSPGGRVLCWWGMG